MNATALLAGDAPFAAVVSHVTAVFADLPAHAVVAVGCSGGRDSVALLHLVVTARPDLLVTAVYVDHGLHDTARDRAVVEHHATTLGVAYRFHTVTVRAGSHGLEAAARDARYDAFDALAAEILASAVLVAHTADDLAETVWMRLLRGTGPDGLSAMRHRDGLLRRPLLSVRRETVHRLVAELGLDTVEDPMNCDRRFTRAQIRHDLFPLFAKAANDPVGAAWRLAMLACDDQQFLAALVDDTVPMTAFGDVAVTVANDVFDRLDVALKRRVVRRMLHQVSAPAGRTSRHSDFAQVQRVVDAVAGQRFTLAGDVEVARDDTVLCVVRAQPFHREMVVAGRAHQVALFGATLMEDGVLTSRFVPPPYGMPARFSVALAVAGELTLRGFRDGDMVFTRGQQLPVKTLFQAAKLPVVLRHHWPVVCAFDRVVWVPGFAVDDACMEPFPGDAARTLTFVPWA